MKKCNKCGVDKNIEDFSQNKGNPDGKNRECKICQRAYFAEYYKNNKEKHKASAKKCNSESRYFIQKIKVDKGCKVCGYNKHAAALHFHHREPENKSFSLSRGSIITHNDEEILKEIEKCDVLCANCHAEHHYSSILDENPNKKIARRSDKNRKPKDKRPTRDQCPTCENDKPIKSKACKECCRIINSVKFGSFDRPDYETLKKLIWEIPTTHIAEKYGVSGKAVEKWCKKMNIEKPPRGYWAKKKSIGGP